VNVGQRSEHLIRVELYKELWHSLLHLDVVSHHTVDCLRNVVHDDIQVNLIWLVPSGVKSMLHCHNIWMKQLLHDLELSVFITLILVNLLDGDALASLSHSGLVDNSK
jgi:hypothetical protein